ncbi:hypothetical protein ACN47E_009038 [Coniothyrium glycines]
MGLLDLPPEIFEHIMHEYVKQVGVPAAWKIRGTCKTFLPYVEYAVFAKPCMNQYLKSAAARNILRQNMVEFLFHRSVKSSNNATDLLPRFIREVMGNLQKADPAAMQQEQHIRRTLCEVIVRKHPNTYACITNSTKAKEACSYIDTEYVSHMLAAAAIIGSVPALQAFANGDTAAIWQSSKIFGHPLDAAVGANQGHIVQLVALQSLRDARSGQLHDYIYSQQTSFRQAINTAISGHKSSVVQCLLSTYNKLFGAVGAFQFKEWLRVVVGTGNDRVLRVLLRVHHHASVEDMYTGFKYSCDQDNFQLASVFLDHQLFGIDEIVGSTYPLETAIKSAAPNVVQGLLKAGASPDGPPYCHSRVRPLSLALARREIKFCHMLRRKGASPRLADMVFDGAVFTWNNESDAARLVEFRKS